MLKAWPAYRLVMEDKVTLGELERLSIDDVELMLEVVDAHAAALAAAQGET